MSSGPGAACHFNFHSKCFHSKWGVERRETRRLARPPERSEDRPERLGAFPFPLRSGKDASRRSTCGDFRPRGRSSVAGRKDSLQRSLPDRRGFRPRASRPVQPLKADPRSGAGRLPRASRELACKANARAPHPAPPSVCLRKTPQSRARREDYSLQIGEVNSPIGIFVGSVAVVPGERSEGRDPYAASSR